jgi:hypothetical protein
MQTYDGTASATAPAAPLRLGAMNQPNDLAGCGVVRTTPIASRLVTLGRDLFPRDEAV